MKDLRAALMLFALFTVICGGVYPALVTGVARVLFPHQAQGSLLRDARGRVIGSSLIGQGCSEPGLFWPRPSATAGFPYNPMASGGSNLGPTNPQYLKGVAARVNVLRGSGVTGPIPSELVQASASGLDPHLSVEAALVQVPRVAKATGKSVEELRGLVARHTCGRQLGILGEPRVNVLELNLEIETAP